MQNNMYYVSERPHCTVNTFGVGGVVLQTVLNTYYINDYMPHEILSPSYVSSNGAMEIKNYVTPK